MVSPLSLLILVFVSSGLSLVILRSLKDAAIPGLQDWMWACWSYIFALSLLFMRGYVPDVLSIVTANALLAVSAILMLQGYRRFFGLHQNGHHAYIAWLVMVLAIVYWTYVERNFNLRVAAYSVFHAAIYTAIGWTTFTMRPRDRSQYSYYFVISLAAIAAGGNLSRCFVYAFGIVAQSSLLESSSLNLIFIGLGVPFMVCNTVGMVMLSHDRLVNRLEKLAHEDELTGLMRRRTFLARAEASVAEAHASNQPLALALLDLDHFKHVNDTLGHAGGDRLLQHFGAIARTTLRSNDIIGRIGGEEFAVLCRNTTSRSATTLLERLGAHLAASPIPGDEQARCTFSAGVAQLNPGETLGQLMARADAQLYEAKAAGRDRIITTPLITTLPTPRRPVERPVSAVIPETRQAG